jgi:hypothetical protein
MAVEPAADVQRFQVWRQQRTVQIAEILQVIAIPAVGVRADVSIKKPRCNLLLQRGLQCRGERIRTSDLLNPIYGGKSQIPSNSPLMISL